MDTFMKFIYQDCSGGNKDFSTSTCLQRNHYLVWSGSLYQKKKHECALNFYKHVEIGLFSIKAVWGHLMMSGLVHFKSLLYLCILLNILRHFPYHISYTLVGISCLAIVMLFWDLIILKILLRKFLNLCKTPLVPTF